MSNDILLSRILKMIAMSYALLDENVVLCYEKVGSIDKVLELAQLDEIK